MNTTGIVFYGGALLLLIGWGIWGNIYPDTLPQPTKPTAPNPTPRVREPYTQQQDLRTDLRAPMAMTIRAAGYRCNDVVYSRADRRTERGDVWKVDCDDNYYTYRVTVTERGGIIVVPWR